MGSSVVVSIAMNAVLFDFEAFFFDRGSVRRTRKKRRIKFPIQAPQKIFDILGSLRRSWRLRLLVSNNDSSETRSQNELRRLLSPSAPVNEDVVVPPLIGNKHVLRS